MLKAPNRADPVRVCKVNGGPCLGAYLFTSGDTAATLQYAYSTFPINHTGSTVGPVGLANVWEIGCPPTGRYAGGSLGGRSYYSGPNCSGTELVGYQAGSAVFRPVDQIVCTTTATTGYAGSYRTQDGCVNDASGGTFVPVSGSGSGLWLHELR